VLEHIGTLRFDYDKNLVFEQDKSVNYHADAFGLCDFSHQPVIQSKSKEEIKVEIEQQQKEKNTPVTVDEKAVHADEEKPRRSGWLWVLLGLLVAAGALYGLHEFGSIRFPWDETQRGPASAPGTYKLPFYEKKWEWKEPVREANIWIVAGIYGHEEDAARLVNSLHKKGFSAAFSELRGDRWYVSFGRYATDQVIQFSCRNQSRVQGKVSSYYLYHVVLTHLDLVIPVLVEQAFHPVYHDSLYDIVAPLYAAYGIHKVLYLLVCNEFQV
jgi:hypothetical protein